MWDNFKDPYGLLAAWTSWNLVIHLSLDFEESLQPCEGVFTLGRLLYACLGNPLEILLKNSKNCENVLVRRYY